MPLCWIIYILSNTHTLLNANIESQKINFGLHGNFLFYKICNSGVTIYVMAGILELFDHPPCLNYKVSFSARRATTIHLPQNKNVSVVPDDISERNI